MDLDYLKELYFSLSGLLLLALYPIYLFAPLLAFPAPTTPEVEKPCGASASKNLSLKVLGATFAGALLLSVVVACAGVVDLVASGAALYVVALFMLQVWHMEWPHLGAGVLAIVAAAAMVFLLPSALHFGGLWQPFGFWRLTSWAASAAVAFVAYKYMVRGPSYLLASGSMLGKVCVVTGCNTGIGYDTAAKFARAGATVIFACRTESKARAAMRQLVDESDGVSEEQLRFLQLDLSSLQSVRAFAEAFRESGLDLHVLVLNAGAILQSRSVSVDNLDMSMASNFFGHFLLVQLLLPSILATERKGGSPRIVQVNSALAFEHDAFDFDEAAVVTEESRNEFLQKDFRPFHVYGQTKVASMMCLVELARRLRQRGSKVPVNAVHPGEILTDITRDMHWIIGWLSQVFRPVALFLMKDSPCGCIGTVYASTSEALATSDDMSGEFLMRLAPTQGCEAWLDKAANERLWNLARTVTAAPDVW